VAIQEGELVAALVEPGELAPRVHQAQQKLPRLDPLAVHLRHHLEEIDLRLLARPVNQRNVNFLTLAPPFTWLLALRNFKAKEDFSQLLTSIHKSKDPPSFIVLLEDSASIVGILIATAGIYFSVRLALPVLDGIASVLIGLVMAATASLIGRETKSLLIGETADQGIVDSITQLAGHMPGVMQVNGVLTVHLGPRQIVVALSLELADDWKTPGIEAMIVELETSIRCVHPGVFLIFIKLQSPEAYKDTVKRYCGPSGQ
jgi:divalent metal cation (Fe/Co/Zn/Cd) transporter